MATRCMFCYFSRDRHEMAYSHSLLDCTSVPGRCFFCRGMDHNADVCTKIPNLKRHTHLCWSCFIPFSISNVSTHPWPAGECLLKKSVCRLCIWLLDTSEFAEDVAQYLDNHAGLTWNEPKKWADLLIQNCNGIPTIAWILSWMVENMNVFLPQSPELIASLPPHS